MNFSKFFGSKKIFILIFLPSIFSSIYENLRYGNHNPIGEGTSDLLFLQNVFLTLGLFLLLMGVYSRAHKKNKVSFFFFTLFVVLIFWIFCFAFGPSTCFPWFH